MRSANLLWQPLVTRVSALQMTSMLSSTLLLALFRSSSAPTQHYTTESSCSIRKVEQIQSPQTQAVHTSPQESQDTKKDQCLTSEPIRAQSLITEATLRGVQVPEWAKPCTQPPVQASGGDSLTILQRLPAVKGSKHDEECQGGKQGWVGLNRRF